MIPRGIPAFDLQVTTIANRAHLPVNGVRAKRINYLRENPFVFFIQRYVFYQGVALS
jgi:hypothetical protein